MITNNPTHMPEKYEDFRAAIEHRATWFYFLIKEAMEAGLDLDFAHKAIFECGCFHGKTVWPETENMHIFTEKFVNDNVKHAFEMELKTDSDDCMEVEFHYCPLVAAWKKLTDDEELIAKLCDIAMDGDRGIVSQYEGLEFHLGRTIAKGDPVCEVCVRKKKK